ncbi:AraC family transcriptional regulator [Ferruginibacter paludis]|uniref:AraC family transcriptional regulator n=1 Tax=Ferruginibacter paludis TaxID=1310417 RepID=UPI0025B2E351|nr:AraC family transcriptional regulator [Ferruginibacter paludis]MDN3659209.1 AraC family transcriptional regulator [Ferruginibacter paludis]
MLAVTIEKHKKKEGFQGQKTVLIPKKIVSAINKKNKLNQPLFITDIGYYPKAKYHYRERPAGAEQFIFIYCLEGKGTAIIGQKKYTINAGNFIIIPAGIYHRYASDDTNPWTIYWVHFKGDMAEAIAEFANKHSGGYKGFIKYNENCIAIFNEIYSQLERGFRKANLVYANMCFWYFLSTFIFNEKLKPPGTATEKDPVDVAIEFMNKHVATSLKLQDLAQHVNVSASHFSFLFKEKTGYSPIEYFNHLKIQKACQFLLFTNLRIKEIAIELGIADHYYFSRLFHKVMGTSPNSYRKKGT